MKKLFHKIFLVLLLTLLSVQVFAQDKPETKTDPPKAEAVQAPQPPAAPSMRAPQQRQEPDTLALYKNFFWFFYLPAFVIVFVAVYLGNRFAQAHGPLSIRRSSKEVADLKTKIAALESTRSNG